LANIPSLAHQTRPLFVTSAFLAANSPFSVKTFHLRSQAIATINRHRTGTARPKIVALNRTGSHWIALNRTNPRGTPSTPRRDDAQPRRLAPLHQCLHIATRCHSTAVAPDRTKYQGGVVPGKTARTGVTRPTAAGFIRPSRRHGVAAVKTACCRRLAGRTNQTFGKMPKARCPRDAGAPCCSPESLSADFADLRRFIFESAEFCGICGFISSLVTSRAGRCPELPGRARL